MKPIVIAFSLALTALPVAAQEDAAPEAEAPSEGFSLMEEGAKLFLKGLQSQMEPALDGVEDFASKFGPAFGSFLKEMGPALSEMAGKVEDWSVYEAPEMLPNGDIILRRKPEITLEETPEIELDEDGSTEL